MQEKMKSKNKLVPRLLGITKESVMRVDERTKDVVQEWPLTTVKRWAASPKSFTLVRDAITCVPLHLSAPRSVSGSQSVRSSGRVAHSMWTCGCLQDFGEYQESYYSVQTTEGEQISQLIAGYIDIILKKVTQAHAGQCYVPENSTMAHSLWFTIPAYFPFTSAFWLTHRLRVIYFTTSVSLLLLSKTNFFQKFHHNGVFLFFPAEAKQRSLWTGRRWRVNHARRVRIPKKVRE